MVVSLNKRTWNPRMFLRKSFSFMLYFIQWIQEGFHTMDDNTGSFFIYKDTRKIYLRAIARENICTIP